MGGALDGCLVLDLSRYLPGPYCSMILADHGARVIALEDKRFEKEDLSFLSHVNRNKEHMALNLKTRTGLAAFMELAKRADVILEGFRPGVMDRLGAGYSDIKKVNPAIVYCSLTGYGQTGPWKDRAGHDLNFAGDSGVLSLIGEKNGPPVIPGVQLADLSGGLNAAIGILLALYSREKSGRGQYIDISMTDSLLSLLPLAAGLLWTSGNSPRRGDFLFSHRYAFYNIFETADGKYVALGALERKFWATLCEYFDVSEFVDLQFDESRREEIADFFRKAFRAKIRDEWISIFSNMDICLSGVLEMEEALESEYAANRQMVLRGPDGPAGIGFAAKLSGTPPSYRKPPPEFGENTERILKEMGFSQKQIDKMREDDAI